MDKISPIDIELSMIFSSSTFQYNGSYQQYKHMMFYVLITPAPKTARILQCLSDSFPLSSSSYSRDRLKLPLN